MTGTATPTKLKPNGFTPRRNQRVIALDRTTGREACDGPFVVTSICQSGGAVKGIDQRNNHREFTRGTWRIMPAGQKGGV